jgi:hypothetical protein
MTQIIIALLFLTVLGTIFLFFLIIGVSIALIVFSGKKEKKQGLLSDKTVL